MKHHFEMQIKPGTNKQKIKSRNKLGNYKPRVIRPHITWCLHLYMTETLSLLKKDSSHQIQLYAHCWCFRIKDFSTFQSRCKTSIGHSGTSFEKARTLVVCLIFRYLCVCSQTLIYNSIHHL